MNYSLEQLKEAVKTQAYSDFNFDLLFEDVEEVLEHELDADENVDRLKLLCTFSSAFEDTAEFGRIFDLADAFRAHLKEPASIASYEYSIMNMYFRLGFAPKVVDHALNVLDSNAISDKHIASVYSVLTICAKEYGQYDRALEYSMKVVEHMPGIEDLDECLKCLLSEDNICTILAASGRIDELAEHIAALEKCIDENMNNPVIASNADNIATDILYFRAAAEGFTDTIIKAYIDSVHESLNSGRTSSVIAKTIDSHIEFLKNMTEEPYIDDCINICTQLIDSDCFMHMGSDEIYRILFKALEKKPDALDSAKVAEYSKRYIKSLETAADKVHDLFTHLLNEEYRIRDINNRYDRLKVKYETDLLTVCYNRPSFELNAAGFIRENGSGSLVFIDIDNLKTTNDTYGHGAGDALLKGFVSIAATVCDKKYDLLYRYAGDEFILLSSRTPKETEALIQNLTSAYNDAPISYKDGSIRIQFSYGIVGFTEIPELENDSSIEEGIKIAVQTADKRMYNCKQEHHKQSKR